MLYILFGITLIFIMLNLVIFEYDFMHPSFIFSAIFGVYEFVCILGQFAYEITLHYETVAVISFGLLVFFVISLVVKMYQEKSYSGTGKTFSKVEEIKLSDFWVYALIVMQLLAIVFFIKYLKNISIAYQGYAGSLSEMISLYDTMTKFWTEIFAELNVPVPMVYRICNPLTSAGAYIVIYVAVNNFVASGKINKLHLVSLGLMAILIILNGSRSPLFRILTMVLILFYVLNKRNSDRKVDVMSFFVKVVAVVLTAGIFFVAMLSLMGRNDGIGVLRYIFIYLGAPIVNLDTYLTSNDIGVATGLFGAQTFKSLYAYIGKLGNIPEFSYGGIDTFAFSSNGIEIGNVYTTYYKFIYDFGYYGVLPLIGIVAIYYIVSYAIINKKKRNEQRMDFVLFIYAYLFNDLIMSSFSARFYETVFEAPFIKLFIVSYLLYYFVIEQKVIVGRYHLKLEMDKMERRICITKGKFKLDSGKKGRQ